MQRLDENLGAAELTLGAEAFARIEDAASRIGVLGARYPEQLERLTGL